MDFPIPGNWLKPSWADHGIASPEATLLTLLWALRDHCGQRTDQVMLANPPCPAVTWSDIVSGTGVLARSDELFILARLDDTADRTILVGRFGNKLDETMPILAFYMIRVDDGWKLQAVRVF